MTRSFVGRFSVGLIGAVICLAALVGCSNSEAIKKDKEMLRGIWIPVKQEQTQWHSELFRLYHTGFVSFKDDDFSLETTDGVWWKATYSLNPGKEPKCIDLKHTSGNGLNGVGMDRAIYRLEAGTLTICFPNAFGDRPKNFETYVGGQVCVAYRRGKS